MKICFIAPYSDLADLACQVKNSAGIEYSIQVGNLEEAVPIAKDAQCSGTQVIISRGGTAAILRRHVDIPVIEIKVTGYDILKVLYPYRDARRKFAVVGYRNVVHGCRMILDMLGMPATELIIQPEEEQVDWPLLHRRLTEMIQEKSIDTIVGDVTGVNLVKKEDVSIELITSGEDAILQALGEATNIIRAREEEKKNSERFQTVLNFVRDGVIAIDEHGVVTVFNSAAEQIFGIKSKTAIGKPVHQVIHNTKIAQVLSTGMAEIEYLQQLKDGHILTNHIPIYVNNNINGVVATFQEVSQIQRTEQKIRRNLHDKGLYAKYSFHDILSVNPQMLKLKEIAKNYAYTNATILIRGESGTGKELFAQSIHRSSLRASGAFVAVNCCALPSQILESELFGYEEGAFTGAKKGGKNGLFELAHGGTVFLDEIGNMDDRLQTKLLRVIEEKQVMRLGSDMIIPVDIRVIAATNFDLRKEVSRGNFRLDLYFRLNVLNLNLPPLRQRRDDIKHLINHYLTFYCNKYNRPPVSLPEELIKVLITHEWLGNVRELRNIAERIVLYSNNGIVTSDVAKMLIDEIKDESSLASAQTLLSGTLADIKDKVIREVLEQEGGNKTKAAKRLGIDRSTINRLMEG